MNSFISKTNPIKNEVEFRFRNVTKNSFLYVHETFTRLGWDMKETNDISISGNVRVGSPSQLPRYVRMIKKCDGVQFQTKERVRYPFDTSDFRISEAKETIIDDLDESTFLFMYEDLHERKRKRTSFMNGDYIVDFTVIDENIYEIEMEIWNITSELKDIVDDIVHKIKFMNDVDKQYTNLMKTSRFAGPLPYTLVREKFEEGVLSCGYSVTDKADGERFHLFSDKNKNAFLIDRNNCLKYCGVANNKNSVIDGELVGDVFYGFDALYLNGKDVREKMLLQRLKCLGNFVRQSKAIGSLKLHTKTFHYKVDGYFHKMKNGVEKKHSKPMKGHVGSVSKELWRRKETIFEYKLDGLIFTPLLKSYYNNNIYKWKPVDTIDFFVEKQNDKQWMLKIAGNYENKYQNLPFDGNNDGKFIIKKGKIFEKIENKIFKDNDLSLMGRLGIFNMPDNHHQFPDKTVVEFRYDNEIKTFVPLRVRDDKSFANNVATINDVWNSLKTPITIDDIENSSYKSAMRPFHNEIKNNLINGYTNGKRVLDIGFGAGGDIHKYTKAGVKNVVGIDIEDPKYALPRYMKFVKVNGDEYCIENELKKKGLGTEYDIINLQFSAHYFFRNDEVLSNFINNLKKCLRVGGKVVMTVLEGDKVRSLIENGMSKGMDGGECIYELRLDNDKLNVSLNGTKYFKEKSSEEYLVPVDSFIERMGVEGFDLEHREGFESYSLKLKQFVAIMCEAEKRFSFMNTSLVFKKIK